MRWIGFQTIRGGKKLIIQVFVSQRHFDFVIVCVCVARDYQEQKKENWRSHTSPFYFEGNELPLTFDLCSSRHLQVLLNLLEWNKVLNLLTFVDTLAVDVEEDPFVLRVCTVL